MIRKTLAFIILFSMMIHCASRLGVLSYLYKNRTEIANSMGLISETPIALCSSDYDFNRSLHIDHHNTEKEAPISFTSATEIILFFQPHTALLDQQNSILLKIKASAYTLTFYTSPHLDIFQPPRM